MRKKPERKKYNVRWSGTHANIDIMATSDHHAKQQADAEGRRMGVSSAIRTIYQGSRQVE
jgi:hypothetical protein